MKALFAYNFNNTKMEKREVVKKINIPKDEPKQVIIKTDDETKQIIEIIHMPCKGFPHGIDIAHGCIAYTSYTESALYICRLPESKELPNLLD